MFPTIRLRGNNAFAGYDMANDLMFKVLRSTILLVGIMGMIKTPVDAQDRWPNACEFSDYNPLRISHFLQGALLKRIKPIYPAEALRKKVEGTVYVRILVDRNGRVSQTCAQGPELLQKAAEDAARQWQFKKNFGLGGMSTSNYVIDTIVIPFRLSEIRELPSR